jgi:integrase
MATIRKRGDKWHVQVRRSGHSRTRSFSHKADADSWARLIERKIDTRELNTSFDGAPNITISELLTRYSEEVSSKKKSACVEIYIINKFTSHKLGALPACELKATDVCLYRDERLSAVKEATVHRELSLLRHCLEVARRDWGIPLKRNPVAEIRMPSSGKPRERRVSESELFSLHQSCTHPVLWQVITIALETAMRRGEIVAMQWDHIDWDNKILHIPNTKNGHPRTIPLTPSAIEVFEELPKINSDVIGMTGNAIRLSWERLKKRAGVTDLRFHDLRHEAISRFFEMGLSVPEVALISGHRDPRMLFRYTHLKAEEVGKKLRGNLA